MPVYVELQTDAFREVLEDLSAKSFDFKNVRRPFRGIEIKDETFVVLKVFRSDGREIPLFDAGSRQTIGGFSQRPYSEDGRNFAFEAPPEGTTFNYSNFITNSIVEARQEKSQVVETFGDPYIFFYGEKPRVLQVRGVLLNTLDFNWKNEFWRNYETYLRGTKLVEYDARLYMHYDDQVVEGYVLDAQATHDSTLPYHIPFSFTLFVTGHTYTGMVESAGMYPISANVQVPPDDLTSVAGIEQVVRRLHQRANKLRPEELESTIDDVRRASEQAADGVIGKDAIVGAILRGMSDFDAKTHAFLSNVKSYFYGRTTVVPRGFTGSELYAGEETAANRAVLPAQEPARTLPLRSKISDNVDEYIGGADGAFPQGVADEFVSLSRNINEIEFEQRLITELENLGVDTSDPTYMQTLRARVTNSIVEMAGEIDFDSQLTAGAVGSLKYKTNQIASFIPNPFGS